MHIESSTQARHHWIMLISLYRCDGSTFTRNGVGNTSSDGLAIEQHGTSATNAVLAAKMCTRELNDVA
jgi:hypothetical protein